MLATDSPADSHDQADVKLTHRSRITNGSVLLPGVDGRSSWARRCRDLIANHVFDLGGPEAISEAEKSIVRRASVLTVELESLEKQFALTGEATPAQLDLYQRTANSLRRLLESIGLQRRARDVSPSLAQFIPRLVRETQGSPPAAETHEGEGGDSPDQREAAPEPSLSQETPIADLSAIASAFVTAGDGALGGSSSPFPAEPPAAQAGDKFTVDGSRAVLILAPRPDGVERWAIVADNEIKAYAMTRSDAERIAREKLKERTS